ncbi:MAG: T9SS type A sorting domain-containing protein, partial [Flavobacteriaceae bacterium]|nr:T9SS type A sorting domain-containing protein [Flavobacteriaceae bacterium]
INTTPVADDPADVEECDSYTLPALTNGNYFTGPGGTGTALFAGDIITSSQTIYVYSPALAPCIAAENSFIVTIKICVINEGCTLGYWKNHTDKWCAAYTTCTLYISIFEDSTLDPNLTLLQALNLRGNTDGENLARQSVAALLNTCSSQVGFFYSDVDTLIAAVNAAWTAGGSTLNTFATTLDGYNNAGCPLGGSRATTKPTPSCVVSTNAKESGNITLESSSKAEQFSAYPVPFKETLNIKYNFDYKSDVTIQIFDMRGQLMKTAKEANASKDKVTTLSVDFVRGNQVYIVRVTTDRESFFKQIISKE